MDGSLTGVPLWEAFVRLLVILEYGVGLYFS